MQTKTTMHLTGAAPRKLDRLAPAILIALVFILAAGLATISRLPSSTAAAVPTPSLAIVIIATAQAQPLPTAAPAAQVAYQQPATRWVTAWAAPNGAVLGPIPEPIMSAITGRYGDGWISTTWQDNTVWVRVSDLGGNLADVAPTAAPQVVYQVVNQPAQAAPEAAPAPIAPQANYQTTSQEKPAHDLVSAPLVEQPAPTTAPALVLPTDTTVQRAWVASEWDSEHCVAGVCH